MHLFSLSILQFNIALYIASFMQTNINKKQVTQCNISYFYEQHIPNTHTHKKRKESLMIACYNSNNNNNKRRKLHRILVCFVKSGWARFRCSHRYQKAGVFWISDVNFTLIHVHALALSLDCSHSKCIHFIYIYRYGCVCLDIIMFVSK